MLPEIKIGDHTFAPKLVPTVLTVIMLAITLSLGVWQLQRAEWKGKLIAEWQAQAEKPMLDELPPAKQSDTIKYRKVRLVGRYQSDKAFNVGPVYKNAWGYDLFVPFKMLSGEILYVNRGFVLEDTKFAIDQPIGVVFAEGILVPYPERTWLSKLSEDNGQYLTLTELYGPVDLYPLYLMANQKSPPGTWPDPHEVQMPYTNNHLTYAFIWFSLGLALVVIYALSQAKKD